MKYDLEKESQDFKIYNELINEFKKDKKITPKDETLLSKFLLFLDKKEYLNLKKEAK